MRSRKPQDSTVQPGVLALGKKKRTTFFLPWKSFKLRVVASFLSGRTLAIWVAGREMSGAGLPVRAVGPSAFFSCRASALVARTRAAPPRTRVCNQRVAPGYTEGLLY